MPAKRYNIDKSRLSDGEKNVVGACKSLILTVAKGDAKHQAKTLGGDLGNG